MVKVFQIKGKAFEVKIKMKDQRTRSYRATGEIPKLQPQDHRGKYKFLALVLPYCWSHMVPVQHQQESPVWEVAEVKETVQL